MDGETQQRLGHPVFGRLAGDTEGDVQALAQQVDAAIREEELVPHGRMQGLEARKQRHQHVAAEPDARADAQRAVELIAAVAQREAGVFRRIAYRAGPGVQAAAGFGQAQAAGAAHEQRQAHSLLDAGDATADGGTRQAEVARGLGEAARLGDAGEQLQRVGIQRFLGDRLAMAADAAEICRYCVDDVAMNAALPPRTSPI